jgi:hypothetical protein
MTNNHRLSSIFYQLKASCILFAVPVIFSYFITSLYFFTEFLNFVNPFSENVYLAFKLSGVKKIPISDAAENISSALFYFNNLTIYKDFIVNHFPGLPILLSFFFSLTGESMITGGDLSYFSLSFISFFITAFFQLLIFTITLRVFFQFSIVSLIIFNLFYSLYYIYYCNLILPLSEMFLIPLCFLASVQVFSRLSLKTKIDINQFSIMIFNLIISTFMGLTALPFFLVYFLIISWFFVYDYDRNEFSFKEINLELFFILSLISSIFLNSILKINLFELFYWNFDFNFQHVETNLLSRAVNYFNYVLNNSKFFKFGQTSPFLAESNFYFYVFIFFTLALFRNKLSRPMFIVFVFFLLLLHWRVDEGYKLYPMLGVCLGFFITVFSQNMGTLKHKIFYQNKTINFIFIISFLSLILVLNNLASLKINSKFENDLNYSHNSCTIKQEENCNCMIQDFWEPDFYLYNNIRPCPDLFPSQFILTHKLMETNLLDSYRNQSFIQRRQINRYYDDLPKSFNEVYQGMNCMTYDYNSMICKKN